MFCGPMLPIISAGYRPPLTQLAMSHRQQTKRQWTVGLALMALVCLFVFSHLAPSLTFAVAIIALFGLIVLFWRAGKSSDS